MRIGIFGGTFDPPHRGHLVLADEAFHHLQLNRLLWVLTADPPHKQDQTITTLEHRLAMTRLVLKNRHTYELSRIEIERPGPHYAADSVRLIAVEFPKDELIYLMGGDSLRDLPTWHNPMDLVHQCREIGVLRRPEDSIDLATLEAILPGLGKKVRFVDAPPVDISSSEIRLRAAEGRSFHKYVTSAVYHYIQDHHLYRS